MCISHHVLSFWRTYKCVSQQRIRRTWSCPKYVSHKALIRPLHARFDALAWFFSRIATFVLVLEVSDDKKITHPFLGNRSSRYLSLCDWVPFVLTDSNSRRRHIRGALVQFIECFDSLISPATSTNPFSIDFLRLEHKFGKANRRTWSDTYLICDNHSRQNEHLKLTEASLIHVEGVIGAKVSITYIRTCLISLWSELSRLESEIERMQIFHVSLLEPPFLYFWCASENGIFVFSHNCIEWTLLLSAGQLFSCFARRWGHIGGDTSLFL